MEGTVDIGLLYAYGFISVTSKASRPEAKISDCHRCLGAGHEQSMIKIASTVSVEFYFGESPDFV